MYYDHTFAGRFLFHCNYFVFPCGKKWYTTCLNFELQMVRQQYQWRAQRKAEKIGTWRM